MSFFSALNPFSSDSKQGETIQFSDAQCDDAGFRALKEFHNHSIMRYPENYSMSFDELQSRVGKITQQSIGFAILANNFDQARVTESMDTLSDKGRGLLPQNKTAWFNVIKDVSIKVDFIAAVKYTVVESAGDIAEGAAQVGDAVLSTGKILLMVLPVAIPAAVLFVLYRKSKSI